MRIKGLIVALLAGLIMVVAGCASVDKATLAKSSVGVKSAQILTTDKSTYNLDEKIKVNFFNSPGNDSDWICIVPAGSPDNEAGDYKYMPKKLDQGSLTFDPPSPGKYEARAYYNYGRNGFVVSGRQPFSVAAAKGIATTAAQPVKTSRDDYVLFQTVTLGDKNKQLTGFSTTGSLAVLKTPNDNMIDYELWAHGQVNSGSNQKKKNSVYGPVRLSRNPATEGVSFSTSGFGLDEEVVNQIMNQVELNPRVEGRWEQKISLKLLRTHLPQKLTFHFHVQKIELKPGVWALLVRAYTDVFTIEILPTTANANNGVFSGMYKGALIYSPEEHRVYQMASSFDAAKDAETLQIQETAFLAGTDGKSIYPLLDMRDILNLKKQDKPAPLVSIPLWAVQALKVREVVNLASATTAERSSNMGGLLAMKEALQLTSELSQLDSINGLAGLPSSSNLIETYASTYGTPAGQEATRLLGNLVVTGAGEVLPGAVLLGPVVPVVLTATSLYTIYDNMAQLSTLVYYDQVLSKIEPFEWPKGDPLDRIAKAGELFDSKEPYVEPTEPGPIPEPPAAPKASGRSGWVLPAAILGGSAIAAGVALGLSGGSSSTSSSTSSCSYSVPPCCTGNPQNVLFPAIAGCSCPSGSTLIQGNCDCNGCN